MFMLYILSKNEYTTITRKTV